MNDEDVAILRQWCSQKNQTMITATVKLDLGVFSRSGHESTSASIFEIARIFRQQAMAQHWESAEVDQVIGNAIAYNNYYGFCEALKKHCRQ